MVHRYRLNRAEDLDLIAGHIADCQHSAIVRVVYPWPEWRVYIHGAYLGSHRREFDACLALARPTIASWLLWRLIELLVLLDRLVRWLYNRAVALAMAIDAHQV